MVPAVFVGSSLEGLEVARAVQAQLHHDAEVTIWNEGAFPLGQSTLESLVNALDRFDFAILVVTPDDTVQSRETERLAPRDNMLFELGLFMGRLGRSKTFAVAGRTSQMKLPSDLAGVTIASFDPNRADRNLVAALGPATTLIRQAIGDLGISDSRAAKRFQAATSDMESITATMVRLVHLLARSRVVELDIIDKQLGGLIRPDFLQQIQKDLEELVAETRQK